MNKISKSIKTAWDWPLRSEFVKSAEDKKSLRSASDFGSAVAGVVVFPPIATTYLQSNTTAIIIAAALVLGGFYCGSSVWKLNRRYRHNLT